MTKVRVSEALEMEVVQNFHLSHVSWDQGAEPNSGLAMSSSCLVVRLFFCRLVVANLTDKTRDRTPGVSGDLKTTGTASKGWIFGGSPQQVMARGRGMSRCCLGIDGVARLDVAPK